MAKNRNKKPKSNNAVSMEISTSVNVADPPQAMDTSEGPGSNTALGVVDRKIKKAVQTRRSKSLRKQKAIAKAISKSEQSVEKIAKNKKKLLRVQSAKSLYD